VGARAVHESKCSMLVERTGEGAQDRGLAGERGSLEEREGPLVRGGLGEELERRLLRFVGDMRDGVAVRRKRRSSEPDLAQLHRCSAEKRIIPEQVLSGGF